MRSFRRGKRTRDRQCDGFESGGLSILCQKYQDSIAEYIDLLFEQFRAALVEQGLNTNYMGMNIADILMVGIESYAYAYMEFVLAYPQVVERIHEINPDALIVNVSMYNTLEGYTLKEGDAPSSSFMAFVSYTTKDTTLSEIQLAVADGGHGKHTARRPSIPLP